MRWHPHRSLCPPLSCAGAVLLLLLSTAAMAEGPLRNSRYYDGLIELKLFDLLEAVGLEIRGEILVKEIYR